MDGELKALANIMKDKEWLVIGSKLVKVHRTSRRALFAPVGDHCSIDKELRTGKRYTYLWEQGVGERKLHEDQWRDGVCTNPAGNLKWVGYSVFELADKKVIACPAMPTTSAKKEHRVKRCWRPPLSAMVARPVTKAELRANDEAIKAMAKEWRKLVEKGVFDWSVVRSADEVRRSARVEGIKAHVGRVFGICVEKGAELEPDDEGRYFKGRYCFQGNDVRDEWGGMAIFNEMSSNPASIEASKALDFYGLLPGHASGQADAEQSYVQSRLGDYTPDGGNPTGKYKKKLIKTETWVRIPEEYKPKGDPNWDKLKDPVIGLLMALYGHPDAGGYWERHCDENLRELGFTPVHENWPSVYQHIGMDIMLMVYVDDFKMSGPSHLQPKAWDMIRSKIKLGAEGPPGKYLGCNHIVGERVVNGRKVRTMSYDMRGFMKQSVQSYKDLCGEPEMKMRKVSTPFLASAIPPHIEIVVVNDGGNPTVTHEDENQSKGNLSSVAASVLMKLLYGARVARWDLLRGVTRLASRISRWSTNDDQ